MADNGTNHRGPINSRDGFKVGGNAVQTKVFAKVAVVGAAITLTPATHAGKIVTIQRLAGTTVTLPAATGTGNIYRILVIVSLTSSNHIIQVANASDTMSGHIFSTLAAGGTTFGETAGGTDDTITMNGTTTGGLIGSYVELEDYDTGLWRVVGYLAGSGTLASALSAAVS